MLTDLIAKLRPTDTSSSAIAAAMERARAAQTEADANVAAAEQAWRDGLLDADLPGLGKLEARLAEAKMVAAATAAPVPAVLYQLEIRHAAARRAETLAVEENARRNVEEAGTALTKWWEKNKSKLAAILREGEQLDSALADAYGTWTGADHRTRAAYPDLVQQMPTPTGNAAVDWRNDVKNAMERPYTPPPVAPPDPEMVAQLAERDRLRAISIEEYKRNHDPRYFQPSPGSRVAS